MLGQDLEDLLLAERRAHDQSGLDQPPQAVSPAVGGLRDRALPCLNSRSARPSSRHGAGQGAGSLEIGRPESPPSGKGDEAEGADRPPLDLHGNHHERSDPLGR